MALDFDLSEDQTMLADVVRGFFAAESPLAHVRAVSPLGFSPGLWSKLRTTDLPGLLADAASGGGGAGLSDAVVVAEIIGASLAPVPLVEHLVAARHHPIESVVSGNAVATMALRPAVDGSWRLVPGGAVADVVVGVDGGTTVAVTAPPPGTGPANHGDQPLADRATSGDRVELGSAALMDTMLDEWRILTAAALVGIADAAMRLAVDYILERRQFGRPIGSYQAIQHGMADFPGLIDGARFLTHKAAWAADSRRVEVDLAAGVVESAAALAPMALVQAGDAATVCTDRSLHYHGGYGFADEYDIQLYFRRARGWANVLGDPALERRRLADLLWPRAG